MHNIGVCRFSTAATVLAVEYSYLAKEMLVLGKLGSPELTLFSDSSSKPSASSKLPMCIEHRAFPLRIVQVVGYFSDKSWKMRCASWILEPP